MSGASTLAIAACSLAIWFFSIAYVGGHLVGFELEKSEVLNGLKLSIFTGSGGATTGEIHKVYLNLAGDETHESDLILTVDRIDEVTASWERKDQIYLCFSGGRIFQFRGYRSFLDGSSRREVHVSFNDKNDCQGNSNR